MIESSMPESEAGGRAQFGDGFAAVGVDAPDLEEATRIAVRAALEGLGQAPDLLAVFASGDSPDALEDVGPLAQSLSGAHHVIGCSAAGVCGAGSAVLGESAVSVWAGIMPGLSIQAFHLEVMRSGDGLAIVGLPPGGDEPGGAVTLLFADPHSFPVVSFVERSAAVLPASLLVGGVAGGPSGAGSTRLYLDDRAVDRGAVGMLLTAEAGSGGTKVVVSQGCRPVGPEMIVTRSEGNVLHELAGSPALKRLYDVLAELTPDERLAFGGAPQIGIAMNEYADEHAAGDFLIRAVIGIDEESQAVTVGDVVEVGRTVRFQIRDAAAARADLKSRLAPAADARGALLISCNGRGPSMFGRADSDIALVRECLGGVPVAGLFAGGEIGPVGDRSWLHGFTASMLAFM